MFRLKRCQFQTVLVMSNVCTDTLASDEIQSKWETALKLWEGAADAGFRLAHGNKVYGLAGWWPPTVAVPGGDGIFFPQKSRRWQQKRTHFILIAFSSFKMMTIFFSICTPNGLLELPAFGSSRPTPTTKAPHCATRRSCPIRRPVFLGSVGLEPYLLSLVSKWWCKLFGLETSLEKPSECTLRHRGACFQFPCRSRLAQGTLCCISTVLVYAWFQGAKHLLSIRGTPYLSMGDGGEKI